MSGRHEAPPSPTDVVVAAIATGAPCPVCSRLDPCRCLPPEGWDRTRVQAELVVAALTEYGHLRPLDAPVTLPEIEGLAKWLAEQSRHPRYTAITDGWKALLVSEADLMVASTAALRHAAGEDVQRARVMLQRWQDEHKSTEGDDERG